MSLMAYPVKNTQKQLYIFCFWIVPAESYNVALVSIHIFLPLSSLSLTALSLNSFLFLPSIFPVYYEIMRITRPRRPARAQHSTRDKGTSTRVVIHPSEKDPRPYLSGPKYVKRKNIRVRNKDDHSFEVGRLIVTACIPRALVAIRRNSQRLGNNTYTRRTRGRN
ncbi:hypothetical protein B0J17DRAFT_111302 [Rhizoctonia solani]|nr:hypothetical protein B0J17DRAFT_111302 [Rhizoctonia solani]